MNIKPCNRHLLIEEITKSEEETKFILPEELKVNKTPFKLVKVIDFASDCEKIRDKDVFVVVPSHMIESITVEEIGEPLKIVQENYVSLIVDTRDVR